MVDKKQEEDGRARGLIKDMVWVVAILLLYISISHLTLGVWQPLVVVESGSMEPHLYRGDVVLIQSPAMTNISTWREGKEAGHTSFGDFGDVILYQKLGQDGTPIIHRAMYFVQEGEPMWDDGPPAPHAGYITKGDNSGTNPYYDQVGSVSYLVPVRDGWVVGVARLRIPAIGHITLLFRGVVGLA